MRGGSGNGNGARGPEEVGGRPRTVRVMFHDARLIGWCTISAPASTRMK